MIDIYLLKDLLKHSSLSMQMSCMLSLVCVVVIGQQAWDCVLLSKHTEVLFKCAEQLIDLDMSYVDIYSENNHHSNNYNHG